MNSIKSNLNEQKKYSFIYATINLVNNKGYVGSHMTNNIEDGYLGSGVILKRVIKKHGRENFKREILEFCLPCKYYTYSKEEYWIKYLGTMNPVGYNFTEKAGGGNLGDIVNNKISLITIGDKNPFYGKRHSKVSREKMIKSRTGRRNTKNTLEKMSKSARNREKVTCPYCNLIGNINMMKFYHFENCVENPKNNKEEILKQRKRKQLICPHCGKVGGEGSMQQWHFDNCKYKNYERYK